MIESAIKYQLTVFSLENVKVLQYITSPTAEQIEHC